MAKYRQIYTEFWSDSFVLELTPEEKYFYLYLISNTKTTQCGIYELSKRIIEVETGYNRETVEKLIKRFCDYKKILYCDESQELIILNWVKYNTPNSSNIILCVNKELAKVKHIEFVRILYDKCQAIGLDVGRIFEGLIMPPVITNNSLTSGLQGTTKGLPSNIEEVISKKQEVINNKKEEVIKYKTNYAADYGGLKNIIKIFEENVHAITPLEYEKIVGFTTQVSSEVIIMAIEEAVNYDAKTMHYIAKILHSWISHGIKTADEVKAYQKKWTNKKKISLNQNLKKGGFCDFDQRTYDFDALEKKLLGLVDSENLE